MRTFPATQVKTKIGLSGMNTTFLQVIQQPLNQEKTSHWGSFFSSKVFTGPKPQVPIWLEVHTSHTQESSLFSV